MDIAVIIPTHDRADRLGHALDSVLSQTRVPTEIIVVDDGSTDPTRDLVRKHYPMVQYIFQANAGVSSARNTGIKASRSRWVAFLDSDDTWFPDKLALQSEALQRSPEYRICHSDEIWIRNGRRVNPMKKHAKAGGRIFTHCLPRCVISPSSVMIERSVFDDFGTFDETLPACEDYDLWLRLCAELPVLFIDKPLLSKFGGHDDQLSRRYPAMDRYRIQALENIIDHPALDTDERTVAISTLLEKIEIVIKGARKRGRMEHLSAWEARRNTAVARLNAITIGVA